MDRSPAARAVTSYAKVELVSLLAGDLVRARSFVVRELGPLASTGRAGATPARDGAGVHELAVAARPGPPGSSTCTRTPVAYRVKRAEEMLGRKVTERPIELTCALTLARTLGPAVLAGEDSSVAARLGVRGRDLGRRQTRPTG